jgi:hypothetical protein
MFTDDSISAGSRSSAAQCSSTARSSAHCSGEPVMAFQWSAQRATVRSVRRRPVPPITIGGHGCCTGFGSQRASRRRTWSPSKVVVSSESSRTMASTPSSKRSKRSRRPGSSMP